MNWEDKSSHLADLLDRQSLLFPKKLSRHAFYSDIYRFYLSENTLSEDLTFLEKYNAETIEACLIWANEHSEFGFSDLGDELISKISKKVKRLDIGLEFSGVKCVERLSHLEHLSLFELVSTRSDANKLNLNGLGALRSLSLPVREKSSRQIEFSQLSGLKDLCLAHYRGLNDPSHSLAGLHGLKTLDLFRPKIQNFESLSHLVSLKLLVCDYARNLADISGLARLQNLQKIEFQNCPNLSNMEVLAELPYLKVLRLVNCRSIETLGFLKNTNVEFLEFIDTAVDDNDVSFIDEMPNLQMFRYVNKRSYFPQRIDPLAGQITDHWRFEKNARNIALYRNRCISNRDDYS